MRTTLALFVAFVCLSLSRPTVAAEVCAGPVTVKGIDVSKWQGTIDWPKVAASGVKFGIARAANGTTVDATFAGNWAKMKQNGIMRGAYQYFQPDMDPVAQANLMVATIGALGPGDLPPVIDVEANTSLPPEAYAAKVSAWLSIVEQKTGRKPMIYTGYYFWKDNVQGDDTASYPLWVARYCTSCCPLIPSPWSGWKFWQHSSTGSVPGISGNVDLNHFNGSLADLQKLAGMNQCQVKCDGSFIVGADCGKGDCAAYGAFCSTAGGTAPHCASSLCVASANDIPQAKDICFEGKRYHCDGSAALTEKACPGGQICIEAGGAHCGVPCDPYPELCNGIDDDCDGAIDEDVWSPCQGCGEPSLEVCNGVDDDCDGVVDDDVTNACGGCGAPGEELCNGVDDDCDGEVDEGVANACGGCGAAPDEVCNGIDDDCDGSTDEGLSCGGGCIPGPEVCDGADDDCDGEVDEGYNVGLACSIGKGACATHGELVCNEAGAEPATSCTAILIDCNDGDPCTLDDCDPTVGCTHYELASCDIGGGDAGGGSGGADSGGGSGGVDAGGTDDSTESDGGNLGAPEPLGNVAANFSSDSGCGASGGPAGGASALLLVALLGLLVIVRRRIPRAPDA